MDERVQNASTALDFNTLLRFTPSGKVWHAARPHDRMLVTACGKGVSGGLSCETMDRNVTLRPAGSGVTCKACLDWLLAALNDPRPATEARCPLCERDVVWEFKDGPPSAADWCDKCRAAASNLAHHPQGDDFRRSILLFPGLARMIRDNSK